MSELGSDETNEDVAWSGAFAKRLREARDHAGMSQETVAEQLGFATRSLTRWETGKSDPGSEKLAKLAELYGVSMDWIAGLTALRHRIRPGSVLLDLEALQELQGLADAQASIRDVPLRLLRTPGLNCAAVVPDNTDVVSSEAAGHIEGQLQELWRKLGGSNE